MSGKKLTPVGPWDLLWRGSFTATHSGLLYTVDVDFFDFKERIHLYRDGELIETQKSPARFELDGATSIEAAMSLFGMKHVDLVRSDDGLRTRFQPRPGTGEARREKFAQEHPKIDRLVAIVSWSILAFALLSQAPVVFNSTVAHLTGTDLPTFALPGWLNVTLGFAGILAALDRALQLKYNRWLDD